MRLAGGVVITLADRKTVLDHDRPDQRVWARATRRASGKSKCASHESRVLFRHDC